LIVLASLHYSNTSARQNKKGEADGLAAKIWPQCLRSSRCRYRYGFDIDPGAGLIEFDFTIDESEQRPVASGSNVVAGDKFRSALPDEDAARSNELTAISFHAQPFADAIAPVADAALTFLMCHKM
jgi:hypothetical protein